MKYQIFSENQWIYPDTEITEQNKAELYSARRSDVCFQILTDRNLSGNETISADFKLEGCDAIVYQLITARVPLNSHAKALCTTDYDSVKHFVTRKAPFDVYDITRKLDEGKTEAGRAAFYVRINVSCDAQVGTHECKLKINIDSESFIVPISLKIYNVAIPELKDSEFHMVNWIYYDRVAQDHGVEIYSDEYMAILDGYLENQIDMRNDFLMLPAGKPVRDNDGKVIDFDFSHVKKVAQSALKQGFKYVMGGFVAKFRVWNEPDMILLWDEAVTVTSIEGYRQLKIYFEKAYKIIRENGLESNYMQCLVDEPQFQNSLTYRALAGICRKCIPGVMINDPIESTDLAGALDIWVVKQAVFETYLDDYKKLQESGETMWIYTCGFPAGYTMNRVMDIPLVASRLPMWMCYKYDAPGFLHWGYHLHNPGGRADTNYHTQGVSYPAGNAHVVYPTDGKPLNSVRAHLQRAGAYDYELFAILGKKDQKKAKFLIEKVCRTFDDYEFSAKALDSVRRQLLEEIG